MSREGNRFNLLKTFYPPRGPIPVFLTVTYQFDESQNQFDESLDGSENQSVWYWSESEVYLVQPLDVLQFTSLFHSNLMYRSGRLELVLDRECSGTSPDFMEILTQRVSDRERERERERERGRERERERERVSREIGSISQ